MFDSSTALEDQMLVHLRTQVIKPALEEILGHLGENQVTLTTPQKIGFTQAFVNLVLKDLTEYSAEQIGLADFALDANLHQQIEAVSANDYFDHQTKGEIYSDLYYILHHLRLNKPHEEETTIIEDLNAEFQTEAEEISILTPDWLNKNVCRIFREELQDENLRTIMTDLAEIAQAREDLEGSEVSDAESTDSYESTGSYESPDPATVLGVARLEASLSASDADSDNSLAGWDIRPVSPVVFSPALTVPVFANGTTLNDDAYSSSDESSVVLLDSPRIN